MHGTGAEIRPDTVTGASRNRVCFYPLFFGLEEDAEGKKTAE